MSDNNAPAAAAETPASTTETALESNPAPEAATQETTTQQPAAETQNTGTPEPQEGQPEGQEDGKRNKKSATEFINELKQQRNSYKTQLEAAQADLARLRQPLRPPGPDAGQDEYDRHNVKAAVREARAEEVQQQAVFVAEQAHATMRATFHAKADAVADRMPGLAQAFEALPVVSNEVAEFVADSDVGAEVAYYMTQNPNEAARISRLPAYQQGIELARIESRISAAPKVRKTSNAPPPPPRMGGASSTTAKDPGSMSMEEYAKWTQTRGKAKNR